MSGGLLGGVLMDQGVPRPDPIDYMLDVARTAPAVAYKAHVVSELALAPGHIVLDVGCGPPGRCSRRSRSSSRRSGDRRPEMLQDGLVAVVVVRTEALYMHGDHVHCDHPKIADFTDLLVRDVMVSRPKTIPATASVADVRRAFDNPHVISALLVDGASFAGMLNRADLPNDAADAAPAREYARTDVPAIGPDARVSDAIAVLDSNDDRRLVVLDDDGVTLAGLICLDESRDSFCQSNLSS